MSIAAKKAQLNTLVKNEKNVKVIVLADGTVQVVDINATNVDDGQPNVEPYVEIKGNKKGKVGVQQRATEKSVDTDAEKSEVVEKAETTKKPATPKAPRKSTKKAAEPKPKEADETVETTEKDVTDSSVAE